MTRRNSPHRCTYCQRPLDPRSGWLRPTDDHVIPQAHGGTKTVRCCAACNNLKADMLPTDWHAFCEKFPRYFVLVHRTGLRGYDLLRRLSPEEIERLTR